ncbi:hypothetical protein [Bailinhaonella thermotolerans]|uniref:hypothetical protein n=1 Tax=Bailinhaonella thermotolerans TaxID=1070861 RepID=UPI00192A3089|nr:hypothetical protein [Bailinhaonella thermotolerans]
MTTGEHVTGPLGCAPAHAPLSYPGRWPEEAGLLRGEAFTRLGVRAARLGEWTVGDSGRALDRALAGWGLARTGERYPLLAIGSNGCPAQMAYKLGKVSRPATLPMVPVVVRGIAVGVSAHVSLAGCVSASPYRDPGAETTLIVSWPDEAQMRAVDATEPNYHRVFLPGGEFPMRMPSGERLGGCHAYVNRHGVLTGGDGVPLRAMPQPGLLARLLADVPGLSALFGEGPGSFVERARADEALRLRARALFRETGRVLQDAGFASLVRDTPPRPYAGIPPLSWD